MNRKKAIWVIVILLLVLAAIAFWLFWKSKPGFPTEEPGSECLLFQSSDPSAPCYFPSGGAEGPGPSTGTSTEPAGPGQIATTSAAFPSRCADGDTTIERNGCVADFAAETRQPGACDFVIGALAKAACMNGVTQKPLTLPEAPTTYENFIDVFVRRTAPTTTRTVTTPRVSTLPVASTTDPRFTLEGFVDRATAGSELKVFALSQYQARPGEEVVVYGSGFVYPSTVMAGSIPVSGLRSADGFSLVFKAPSSAGEYEISVTNSKGSSGSARPKLLVTDNPAPRPQITGASPSVVDVSGQVTLMGIGFMSTNIITTTLGMVENVPSSGTSLTFRIADLTIVPQVKDLPDVKGKRIPVGVYVNNANGFNKDLFYFDVQF